jgi:hypothetical protein
MSGGTPFNQRFLGIIKLTYKKMLDDNPGGLSVNGKTSAAPKPVKPIKNSICAYSFLKYRYC